jgi:glycosyltransferase involved in cell wall biosynthesis
MYNAKDTIETAMRSVLNQKKIDIDIIIVDHGSNDGCYEFIKQRYGESSNIHIIRLERIEFERRSASRPLNSAFYYGLELVDKQYEENTYFIRLDADDFFYSDNAIEKILCKASEHTKIVNGQIIMYDNEKKLANSYSQKHCINDVKTLLNGAVYAMAHHSSLIESVLIRNLFNRDGYFYREDIGYGEDLDFSIRLLEQCDDSEIQFWQEPLIIKKLDGDSISNKIGFKDVIMDHIKIFFSHKEISKILLIKILLWFTCRSLGILGNKINSMRKPPAYKYAEIKEFPFLVIKTRYESLIQYQGGE